MSADLANLPRVTAPRARGSALRTVPMVERRERYFFLGTFYAWCARKGATLPGNDPVTGRPASIWDPTAVRLGRAAYAALAREAFAIARECGPTPLP